MENIEKTIINCENGRKLESITVSAGVNPEKIFSSLGLNKPESLIVLSGGADKLSNENINEVRALLSLGVAHVALECGSLIFDGGTKSGVMEIMGQGIAHYGHKTPLVGFAPEGKVVIPGKEGAKVDTDSCAIDQNHSHFVFVKGKEWGDEIATMYAALEHISKGILTVTVLVNGGKNAKKEILQSVRLGFPIIVIQGSGRLADEIASLVIEIPSDETIPPSGESRKINDIELAEIIDKGKIVLFPIADDYKDLSKILRDYLAKDRLLEHVWKNFACFDKNADRFQRNFKRVQNTILIIAILGTLFAVSKSFFFPDTGGEKSLIEKILHILIIAVPIVVSGFISMANKFSEGNKWILLRANAETLKAEIYSYRTRTGAYRDHEKRKSIFETRIKSTIQNVSKTEVSATGLKVYDGPLPPDSIPSEDDGFKPLTSEDYIDVRLDDQRNYYQGKTARLGKCLKGWQIGIYFMGGLGTFLAAIGLDIWIALTTGIVGAIVTFLAYQQIESTLAIYNQTVSQLNIISGWWKSLSVKEQIIPVNFDKLVRNTESVLKGELAGWVQEMQDALVDLKKNQSKDEHPDETGS